MLQPMRCVKGLETIFSSFSHPVDPVQSCYAFSLEWAFHCQDGMTHLLNVAAIGLRMGSILFFSLHVTAPQTFGSFEKKEASSRESGTNRCS
jgi:hypothetical protein